MDLGTNAGNYLRDVKRFSSVLIKRTEIKNKKLGVLEYSRWVALVVTSLSDASINLTCRCTHG